MASSVAAFSATSTGLSSVSRRIPAHTRISPASAATRASRGTSWSIWYGWVRKCWPAETSSKPSSRASRTCSQQSRAIWLAEIVRRVLC